MPGQVARFETGMPAQFHRNPQQAIDGTKLQANAAKDRTYDAKGLQRLLERTDTVIEELEKQNEAGDDPTFVHLPEKLRQAQFLRTEVEAAMEPVRIRDETDRDLARIREGAGDVPNV